MATILFTIIRTTCFYVQLVTRKQCACTASVRQNCCTAFYHTKLYLYFNNICTYKKAPHQHTCVRLSGPKRRVVPEHCVRTLDDFVKENRGFLSKNTLENASYCGPLSEKSIKMENVRVVLKILQVSIHTTDLSFSSFFHQKIYNIILTTLGKGMLNYI